MDQFKFRLNEHAGLCYFEGVSFKTPNLTEPDQRAVVEFFEGTCLNHLRPSALRAALPHLAILPALQELVNDLQQIFCD